ncbi:putative Peptidase S8/S53 domain-containing protein [Seiridium cardinale]|uniref:Peptidase S8/S53 domain-containing protein n=1 Tax=Seiridium cardinale TaxID=138064 RepID=A0ABR2XTQ5_9PEZI
MKAQPRTTAKPGQVDIKKAAVYETIVSPLERLIKLLGFSDNINSIEPIDSRALVNAKAPIPFLNPAPKFDTSANMIQDKEANKSTQWIDQLAEVNSYMRDMSRRSGQERKRRQLRIAVLDTGDDDEAVFFQISARRRRIKQWRDFYENSEDPIDENGHGSHTTALVMKIAPTADIYVARVTKDRASLKDSATSVAELSIAPVSRPHHFGPHPGLTK